MKDFFNLVLGCSTFSYEYCHHINNRWWDVVPIGIGALIAGAVGVVVAPLIEWFKRRCFRAKLVVTLNQEEGCITRTTATVRNGSSIVKEFYCYYIRAKVTTEEEKYAAKNCRAYLINIEKQAETGKYSPTDPKYCDGIPLKWSCQDEKHECDGIKIQKGINQYVDTVVTKQDSPNFWIELMVIPNRYSKLFEQKGKFRFTVKIVADNAEPVEHKFEFEWNGVWDDFSVNGIPVRNNKNPQ